jgi:hypothetical protein
MRKQNRANGEKKIKNCFLRISTVRVEMSPTVFLALCGLVKDALIVPSDATPVLQKAAAELTAAFQDLTEIPETLEQHSETISTLGDTAAESSKQAVA